VEQLWRSGLDMASHLADRSSSQIARSMGFDENAQQATEQSSRNMDAMIGFTKKKPLRPGLGYGLSGADFGRVRRPPRPNCGGAVALSRQGLKIDNDVCLKTASATLM